MRRVARAARVARATCAYFQHGVSGMGFHLSKEESCAA